MFFCLFSDDKWSFSYASSRSTHIRRQKLDDALYCGAGQWVVGDSVTLDPVGNAIVYDHSGGRGKYSNRSCESLVAVRDHKN